MSSAQNPVATLTDTSGILQFQVVRMTAAEYAELRSFRVVETVQSETEDGTDSVGMEVEETD